MHSHLPSSISLVEPQCHASKITLVHMTLYFYVSLIINTMHVIPTK